MVEGPDGQMMSKKAYKKLMKKLEKEKKKEESNFDLAICIAQKRVQAEQKKAKKANEDDTTE